MGICDSKGDMLDEKRNWRGEVTLKTYRAYQVEIPCTTAGQVQFFQAQGVLICDETFPLQCNLSARNL